MSSTVAIAISVPGLAGTSSSRKVQRETYDLSDIEAAAGDALSYRRYGVRGHGYLSISLRDAWTTR